MEFLRSESIWIYFIIFFGKIIEVTFATLRMILINRGERKKGSIAAFIEVLLWIYVTGMVLVGFQTAPLKVLVFAVAYAIGNYFGSWLESKLALGLCTVEVITKEDTCNLMALLRENNLGVTLIEGQGVEGAKKIFKIHLKRSRIVSTVKLINQNLSDCVISVTDVKVLKGAFIR